MIDALSAWLGDRRDTLSDLTQRVFQSLWFVPTCWLVSLCVLAMGLILAEWFYIDQNYWEDWFVLWRSQADGAKTMLGAIAGATLTVVSLAFSLMMVVVIQTANAYSPRLLSQFIADRHNHHVLGLLMGSFAYALLTLRSIRQEPDFVPHIAVNVALLLSIASIIALISFIQNVAQSIQVASIITLIESQTIEVLESEAERGLGEPHEGPYTLHEAHAVCATMSGYIRIMEHEPMEQLLDEEVVVMWHKEVGDHLIKGETIATIWQNKGVEVERVEEIEQSIQNLITVGNQRAWLHDVRYGFQQLTDIALKALSPGINDPTTALMVLHSLTKLYREVLVHYMHSPCRADTRGELRLIFREQWLERLLVETFWQIFTYGKTDFMVTERMITSLAQLTLIARERDHFEVLSTCLEGIVEAVEIDIWSAPQKARMASTIRDTLTQKEMALHRWEQVEQGGEGPHTQGID